jgi:hypothetical protein
MLNSLLRINRRIPSSIGHRTRWMSSNGFDSSIPDEWVEEPDETEGEWKGCTKRFLAPIKINSRGSGEIAFATVSLYL